MKVEVDDDRNIKIEFEGVMVGLCTVGARSWSQPDHGKNKRYRALCDRLTSAIMATLASYEEGQK